MRGIRFHQLKSLLSHLYDYHLRTNFNYSVIPNILFIMFQIYSENETSSALFMQDSDKFKIIIYDEKGIKLLLSTHYRLNRDIEVFLVNAVFDQKIVSPRIHKQSGEWFYSAGGNNRLRLDSIGHELKTNPTLRLMFEIIYRYLNKKASYTIANSLYNLGPNASEIPCSEFPMLILWLLRKFNSFHIKICGSPPITQLHVETCGAVPLQACAHYSYS
jgi:hypothetical protein